MADRNTMQRDGKLITLLLATLTLIEAGKIVAVNASGYAVPASDAAGLTVMGRAERRIDNSSGADGDLSVPVLRKGAFFYDNSSTSTVTQAHIGKTVYVEDDETVAAATTHSIAAGKCLAVESNGVWVEVL